MRRITFVATSRISASAETVFDWHEAPGAFEQLTPPGERVRVVQHQGGIRDGARVSLRVGPEPFPLGPQASVLEDAIEYELPLGTIGWLVGRLFAQRKLKRLFAFRHAVTRQALKHPPV